MGIGPGPRNVGLVFPSGKKVVTTYRNYRYLLDQQRKENGG